MLRFLVTGNGEAPDGLPFAFGDYLELVDLAGREIRDDKRGAVAAPAPLILARVEHRPGSEH